MKVIISKIFLLSFIFISSIDDLTASAHDKRKRVSSNGTSRYDLGGHLAAMRNPRGAILAAAKDSSLQGDQVLSVGDKLKFAQLPLEWSWHLAAMKNPRAAILLSGALVSKPPLLEAANSINGIKPPTFGPAKK